MKKDEILKEDAGEIYYNRSHFVRCAIIKAIKNHAKM
jgi:hypothetical protein